MKAKLILLSCIMCSAVFAENPLTLEECQQQARDNYPLIKQFDLIEQSKKMTISNIVKAYFPKLSITAIGGVMDGMPTISMPNVPTEDASKKQLIGIAQLEQVIWDGGVIKAQKKIAQLSSEVEKANVEATLYAIRDQVNQLFFGVLLVNEQLKQLDIYNENLQRNLKKAEVAQANGVAYQSDVDALKVEMLNVEQQRTELNAGKASYLEMLSHLTGISLDTRVELIAPVNTELLEDATIIRPELNVFTQQRNLYNAQNSAITAQLMPKFGLMGFGVFMEPGVSLGTSNLDHILVAGLSVSWNIGALYTQNNDRKKIKNNLLQVDVQEETFLFNTNLKLKQSNNEILKSKQLLEKDDEIIHLRSNIKLAAEIKYENGICTMTDLIKEINAEHLANQSKTIHKIQYWMNVYNYQNTIGN